MGRAGAGGYATVQHAYDTRLKRDVAIKCIKINPNDVAKARISIHDAQIENASRPLIGGRGGGAGTPASAGGSGFVSLNAKINEPTFLSTREKQAEKRARRRGLIRTSARPGVDAQQFGRKDAFGYDERDKGKGGLFGRDPQLADTEDFDDPDDSRRAESADGDSFDLSDFASYSNFKGKSSSARGRRGASSSGHSDSSRDRSGGNSSAGGDSSTGGRPGGFVPVVGAKRRVPTAAEASENSFGLAEFAAGLPGVIKGAGQADIGGIGDDPINFAQTEDISALAEEDGPSSSELTQRFEPEPAPMEAVHDPRQDPRRDRINEALQAEHHASPYPELHAEPVPMLRTADPLASVEIPGLEEARTAAHLNDVNIVTVYDCVVEGDTAYVIMEYVEGKTLARIMRDLGNDITLDMVASVFNSVAHALEVAHNANVLHLDIKPENVIVNSEGVVKVTDFGLSTLMDATGHGQTGGGTIGYMPLEQMRQQRLDVRTDEWALASLTYEMLSGKNPFKARNLRDAEEAIEGAELVIPSLCWENIDESVDDIMFDALSPEMDGRFRSIKEFSDELSPLLGDPREGKAQLAQAIQDVDIMREEPREERQREPRLYIPFIDRLGVRGSNILMRAFSALGVAMIVIIAMINFRMPLDIGDMAAAMDVNGAATFGLFTTLPLAAWIAVAVFVALGALFPRFAMPVAYLALCVMLFFNQAWALGIVVLLAMAAWWWLFGRQSDMMCTLAVLQPLFGSIGFSAIVPVITGAILDVRDALFVTIMVALSAITFASFGSADIGNWDIVNYFIVAINPEIARDSINEGFVATMTSPENWCMLFGWITAALAYSWLCRRGTHLFDILGSIACGVLVIGGTIIYPILAGQEWLLTPITISSIVVAAIIGIVLALLNVPDRVRMAPGEW